MAHLTADRMNDEELSKFFKAWKTVNQMLRDRGYLIEDDDLNKSFDEFRSMYDEYGTRSRFKIYAVHQDDGNDNILIFFPEEEKLGVPTIKEVCKTMEDNEVSKGIIVMKVEVTAFARRALDKVSGKCQIETFKQSELMINITKHKLVPQHEILSDKEKKKLLEKYKLNSEHQLPKIQKNDPVARYFGAQKSQVFKITRKSETAGRYVTYRIVV
mmetsp:Transcript_47235/g.78360  ORF Transcript_47235/g.78360 Transcript_47235/m.78360 type:complete len:214 (-) Transcript_47235:137-778(-)